MFPEVQELRHSLAAYIRRASKCEQRALHINWIPESALLSNDLDGSRKFKNYPRRLHREELPLVEFDRRPF